jgi:uncharacterized protein (UPF0335 family)
MARKTKLASGDTAERIEEIGHAHGMPQSVIDAVKEDMVPPGERLYQQMAEMAYQPPAQVDAFTPTLSLTDAGKKLLAFFERIERLDEERQAAVDDINEVFAEAKGEGWDVKAMKALLKIRNDDEAESKLAMLKLYHDSINMKVWPS